ncbi:MAG: AMP-dependent synthetase, partial [Desulfobacteraceae bacterium]
MIHEYLEKSARRFPDKEAFIQDERRVSYAEANKWSDSFAACLQIKGIRKGDRIALLMDNCIEYILAYYGILKAGAVAVPLSPKLKPDGLTFILNEIDAAAVITTFKSERLLKAAGSGLKGVKLMVIQSPRLDWPPSGPAVVAFEACISSGELPVDTARIESADLASIIYTSGSTG